MVKKDSQRFSEFTSDLNPTSRKSEPPVRIDSGRGFAYRLKQVREEAGLSQEELAKKIGSSKTSIQSYERGHLPKGDKLLSLSEALSCSIDWLLKGEHCTVYVAPTVGSGASLATPSKETLVDFVMVSKVRARLSAENGGFETEDPVGKVAFRNSWIDSIGQVDRMVLMDVAGNSMFPVLNDGDTVLIDQGQTEIIAGKIYAVGIDDEVVVRVLDKAPGKLILRSLNRDYPPLDIDMYGGPESQVRIVGRVVWWCREA